MAQSSEEILVRYILRKANEKIESFAGHIVTVGDLHNLVYMKMLADIQDVVGDFMDDIQYSVFPSIRDLKYRKDVIKEFPIIWRKVHENEKAVKKRIIELSNLPEAQKKIDAFTLHSARKHASEPEVEYNEMTGLPSWMKSDDILLSLLQKSLNLFQRRLKKMNSIKNFRNSLCLKSLKLGKIFMTQGKDQRRMWTASIMNSLQSRQD